MLTEDDYGEEDEQAEEEKKAALTEEEKKKQDTGKKVDPNLERMRKEVQFKQNDNWWDATIVGVF